MKHAFLSRSFAHRHDIQAIARALQQAAAYYDIVLYDFVTQNTFEITDAVTMMQTSFAEIRKADFIIAEVSHKAIGVGIEMGYAVALQKPVLYVRHSASDMSTTVSGIAAMTLIYDNPNDLLIKFPSALEKILLKISG